LEENNMPAAPKHRQPIVNTAVTLFRRQGYSRTGLNEIVDVSGAPKGSLYHYFPLGKSSIAVAAVEEAGTRVAATLTRLAQECRSTGELLRRHAELLAGWMRSSGFRDGCPITTVLLELAPGDRNVTEAGRSAYRTRVSILADKLVEDGFQKARADALATLCTSALQGALIQARVERSSRPIEITAAELAKLLDAVAA
jgi:TetR/AcrR family transcriptional regulator, lmrAB and yxaGH operons repressor